MGIIVIGVQKLNRFVTWLNEKHAEADANYKKYKRAKEYWRVRLEALNEVGSYLLECFPFLKEEKKD